MMLVNCCNDDIVCSRGLFVQGTTDTDFSKFTYYPPNTKANWHLAGPEWGTAYVFENNQWYEGTPRSAFTTTIPVRDRMGNEEFIFSFQAWSVWNPNIRQTVSQQVGVFIADAFVMWIDFTDWKLRWMTCAGVPTLPDVGTGGSVVRQFTFNPLQMTIIVSIFKNENGKYNLQWTDPFDIGFGQVWNFVPDIELPGLNPGPITFGGVTGGVGGGGFSRISLQCATPGHCNQCWDGRPMTFEKDSFADLDFMAGDKTTMSYWGSCMYLADGASLKTPTAYQVGYNSFLNKKIMVILDPDGELLPYPDDWLPYNDGPFGNNLASAGMISFWLQLTDASAQLPINDPELKEKIVLWARFGNLIVAAVWACDWLDFCCYGESTFTQVHGAPNSMAFFIGGLTSSNTFPYWPNYGWPETVKIKANGVDIACDTVTCVYAAEHNPPPKGPLVWKLLDSATNQHQVCPDSGEKCAPLPPIDPRYDGQRAYVQC